MSDLVYDDDADELEWAVREYTVATAHLMEIFAKHEDMNARIARALTDLTDAINQEWA